MKDTVIVSFLLRVLCLLAVAGSAVAGESIGVVRNVSGDASVTRGETTLPAAPGMKLLVGDTLGIRGTRFAVKVGAPSSR